MVTSATFEKYKTHLSQAFWCSLDGKTAKFEPAAIAIGGEASQTVSWFDKLFEGGLLLPESMGKPLTFLVTGPPGSGKTTFALEFCYRMAKHNDLFSLYISTEAETDRLIEKAKSFGFEDINKHVIEFEGRTPSVNVVTIWGQDKIKEWTTLSEIVAIALDALGKWLIGVTLQENVSEKLRNLVNRWKNTTKTVETVSPDMLVVDSLNMVKSGERGNFFEQILAKTTGLTKLIVVILDSSSSEKDHEYWEYVCDNVVRLDYNVVRLDFTTLRDYYIRTIEVIKARYQPHVWGKHQLKIYPEFHEPAKDDDYSAKMRRAHPYRKEGGIFIFPSIHFYLSSYKRLGSTTRPSTVRTYLDELSKTIGGGFPEGRCTAFMGCRGGHKSHLGYLHILHRIKNSNDEEGGLIISLRDDEEMTRATMRKILKQEFLEKKQDGCDENELDRIADSELRRFELHDKLEILYYPPGYITPDEFFHRMYMSIHRLKTKCSKLTLMFNSLDQLSARFPLCSQQPIFIPGIIETLSGERITSIFIAVDEPGQPAEQYGLLPMADLILTFYQYRFKFDDYYEHHAEARQFNKHDENFQRKVNAIREQLKNSTREAIVLQVSRFSGGQQAGARGLLELVDKERKDEFLCLDPGLHFTPLSSKFSRGKLIR